MLGRTKGKLPCIERIAAFEKTKLIKFSTSSLHSDTLMMSSPTKQLEELMNAGMSVARFNFSHGDHEGHKACLDRVREAAKNVGKHVGKYNPKQTKTKKSTLGFLPVLARDLFQS